MSAPALDCLPPDLKPGHSLGLIAGGGQFPDLVLHNAQSRGLRVAAVGFAGHTDPLLGTRAAAWQLLHLGQLGRLIAFFKQQQVRHVVLAGGIHKPKALDIRPDFRAARLIWRMRGKGDDALLRSLLAELEDEGFVVLQAAAFLPELYAPQGVLSARPPSAEEWADLQLAWEVAATVGRLDIGQCVVLKRGVVAAVEALEGTDAAIRRGAELAGQGCVVLKRSKPGQDQRVDLPALGLDTMRVLIQCGASCLGFEAGKTLFFDCVQAASLADRHGIALVGLTDESLARQH